MSARRIVRNTAVGAGIIAGCMAMGTAPATAADVYAVSASSSEAASLLEVCQALKPVGGCKMSYVESEYSLGYATPIQVHDRVYNYGALNETYTLTWSHTYSESDTLSVSASVKASVAKVVEASVTTTYSHTWTTSDTVSKSTTITIPSCRYGFITHSAQMGTTTGSLVLNFSGKVKIHGTKYKSARVDGVRFVAPTGTDGVISSYTAPIPSDLSGSCDTLAS
ncbi:hypothetical protein V1460_32035 [Streptomyces sp. SCSIO 30461]|uniref:hypothetical protein n=1 Tax=Streptomyces sp. SCSIO 30461 TaxID=3118085 RepID=UPI0030CD2BD3